MYKIWKLTCKKYRSGHAQNIEADMFKIQKHTRIAYGGYC